MTRWPRIPSDVTRWCLVVDTLESRILYTILDGITDQSWIACKTKQSEMANTSPRHMPVRGNVHPIKIIDVISLLARVFILLIDTATQEVPMKNIWKKLSFQFLRYAIEFSMAQFWWYDCTFIKQCTVPVTLRFDLWKSMFFSELITTLQVSCMNFRSISLQIAEQ